MFLMVSALTQQIAKGPVDCVTEKALYTLSEDWLLWQAQDFSSLVHTHLPSSHILTFVFDLTGSDGSNNTGNIDPSTTAQQ